MTPDQERAFQQFKVEHREAIAAAKALSIDIEGILERQLLTEDEKAFGVDAWIYCNQHLKPHQTGWCSVAVRDKIGLGVKTASEAYSKCLDWGLELYEANQQKG